MKDKDGNMVPAVAQSAKQGQTLNANQQAPVIVRIADLTTMTVQSQVSEADVASLKPGMPVYFTTLGDAGKRWYGKLRQINPTPETVNNVVLYDDVAPTVTINQAAGQTDPTNASRTLLYDIHGNLVALEEVPLASLFGRAWDTIRLWFK